MEETLIDLPRVIRRDEPALAPCGEAVQRRDGVLQADLPAVAPGELWLIEFAAAADLSALEHYALTGANVIIYDRELQERVAAVLPIGGYAEPSVGDDIRRCVQFARDGWSVVRLIERAPTYGDFADRARRLAARLRAAGVPPNLSVAVLSGIGTSRFEKTQARFDEVDALIDRIRDETGHALVFSAFGSATTSRLYTIGSNGLAG